jgi:RNA polymerase sigma-70 factor (ECF subfamily)
LRYVFDLSYADIATILDISESAAKVRLNRAHEQLKKHFQQKCSWYDPGNPCTCENKMGYVVSRYPQILTAVKEKVTRPEYMDVVKHAIHKNHLSLDEMYQHFPMLQYPHKSPAPHKK